MNSSRLMHFLKQADLVSHARAASPRLQRVLTDCLDADDELLIISDYGNPSSKVSAVLGGGFYLAANSLGLKPHLLVQKEKSKGGNAEPHIEDALSELPMHSTVIMAVHSLGTTPGIGKSFRKFARSRKHRFISSTGLGSLGTESLPSLLRAMDLDYPALRRRSLLLKTWLDGGKELRLTTPAGTDLWLGVQGKRAISNDGSYSLPGQGGNMPAGEVYMAPRKKQAEGRVVVDGSSRNIKGTLLARQPVTLMVENGDVISVEGGLAAIKLQESIDWAMENSEYTWGIRRLSEFGIGTNPNAKIVGAMILDEKALNTAHVAIGSNHWFGGTVYSIIHLDQVMRSPTIEVDGEPLPKELYT